MYKVLVDSTLDNSKLNGMLINLHQEKPFIKRVNFSKRNVFNVKTSPLIAYEILIAKKDISFYYTFDKILNTLALNEFNVCYPKSNLKEDKYIFKPNYIEELQLKEHSFLSLKTGRGLFPLSSFLESSRVLKDDEKVVIQFILEPVSELYSSNTAIEDFQEGHLRKKIKINGAYFMKIGAKIIYYTSAEIMSLFSLILTNEDLEIENLSKLENTNIFRRGLSENTKIKSDFPKYDTSIRVTAQSTERSNFLVHLFENAFNAVEEDNKLELRKLKYDKLKLAFLQKNPIDKIYRDLLSTKELSQLLQLPTISYQHEYNLQNIEIQETLVPDIFRQDGIQIATAKFRGKTIPINFPIKDKNNLTKEEINSLCQCWISIGKMGTGKTTNGENLAIQLVNLGISVFAIDVADGKMIDNIENKLPKEFTKIIDLNFGDIEHPIPLSWTETATHGATAIIGTKIASQLKNFLNKLAKTETSDRMERFLGAAAKAVYVNPDANLYDVVLCLTDKNYRHNIIKENKIEGRVKQTLLQLDDPKTGTKNVYIAGIMDRLEALLDNEFVANCLLQKANPDIDFRKWADEGYFIGIRLPKSVLLDDATDLLVTYIVSKLWLAILSRQNIQEEERKPCFLILDEPHQFPTVLSELYSIIREMRKWHLGTIILAHEFGDFKDMKKLLKSAGTNYFIYSTSKETYKDLQEELQPYTLEQCLKTPWHNAIINIRYKDKQLCIVGNMLKPKNGTKRAISNIYGNDIKEVQKEIYEKCDKF